MCGRLIKGYGATNERGKENLLHVLDHLAQGAVAPKRRAKADRRGARCGAGRRCRQGLDAALVAHGAPARPVKAQPIRFVRKPGSPNSQTTA